MTDSFPQADSANKDQLVEGSPSMMPRGEMVGGASESKSAIKTAVRPGTVQQRAGREVQPRTQEGLQHVRRLLQREQRPQEPSSFKTPYCQVTFEQAQKAIENGKVTIKTQDQDKPHVITGEEKPAIVNGLRAAFAEIDNQVVENFGVFESRDSQGVGISYSRLRITPDVVKRIKAAKAGQTEKPDDKSQSVSEDKDQKPLRRNQVYFIFTPFGLPPDASAFTVQDGAIDRFFRELPLVARALRNGESPPSIDIYLVGYPTGFGGRVTKEYVQALKTRGLSANGPIYSEFVEEMLRGIIIDGSIQKQTHVVLQGLSMGAVNADWTYRNLPDQIRSITHGLMDVPAGDHANPLRGAQVAAGMALETGARMAFDPMMKSLMRLGGPFMEYMHQKTGIPKDNAEQKSLKADALKRTGLALLRGSPLDTEHGGLKLQTKYFIRTADLDPLTTDPVRLWKSMKGKIMSLFGRRTKSYSEERRERNPQDYQGQEALPAEYSSSKAGVVASARGDSMEVTTHRTHFFMNNNYNKQTQAVIACQNI